MAKKGATLCPFAPSLVSCKSAEVLWKESRERDSNSLPLLRQFSRDRFYSNLQERGDCQNTRKTHKATRIVGWVVGWKNGPDVAFLILCIAANRVRFKTYTSSIPPRNPRLGLAAMP